MKRFYFIAISLLIFSTCLATSFRATAQSETNQPEASPNIVISQFQTAGGTNTNDEFVELHNTSSNSVDLNGFRLVYRSAAGTSDVAFVNWTTSTIITPGGYYLIASTSYDDSVAPNITYNPTSCSCSMSGSGGGLAIRSGALNSGIILDSVGYGTATNAFIETAVTAAPPANASRARQNNGCQDTDNNANDFSTVNPSAPRSTASPANACGGGGMNLLAGGGANPNTAAPGGMTLLTVSVLPATNPPSTGISVFGNLSNIGGAANQQFYDDGTNGDVTANDNTFSYSATIPAGASGGVRNITATASDAESRAATVSINITINAPMAGENHLLLGNPSNATPDVANENNYLMIKPQYSLSYNRSRAIPNWVSWRLDSSWLGNAPRQDDFRSDPALPAGWYRVTDSSYSGSGFDRGHHTPSGDRTRSIPDNSATFLMTNIMPQSGGNNQGPWEKLETFSRTLASQGNELYIVAGSVGVGGIGSSGSVVNSIDGGRITVPAQTWKVIVVLPVGDNDVSRVNNNTRAIAVIMPNAEYIRPDAWQKYLVTVDQVEAITGYDFFSNVAPETQAVIESRVDGETNAPPTITAATGVTRQQGNPVSNSQIASVSDANQIANSLILTINGGTSATVNGVTVSNIAVDAAGVVTANVAAASDAAAASFTLRITDNKGSFAEITLNIAVTPGSYEADVASRPTGDRQILSNDVTQMERFLNELDAPSTQSEFQRADSAPRINKGDGKIDSADVIQTIRYLNELDTLQTTGGPAAPANVSLWSGVVGFDKTAAENMTESFAPAAAPTLRVESISGNAGGQVSVNIRVDAAGDESLFGFALLFDPTVLSFNDFTAGDTGAGTFSCNTTATAGRIRCSIGSFPNNQAGTNPVIGEINGVDNQMLIKLTFSIPTGSTTGTITPLTLTSVSASDELANSITPATVNGTVTITAPTTPKSRKRVRFI